MGRYLLIALGLTLIIPAFGVVMGLVRKLVYRLIGLISPSFAFALINYLTFPGVIHHELSHALFGFVTGAKIRKINVFKPQGMSLGSVEMSYRGPWLLRSIQGCLSSAAPVFCGAVSLIFLIAGVMPVASGLAYILLFYLIFSIMMHMTMSISDLICYFKGAIGMFLIIFVILVVRI